MDCKDSANYIKQLIKGVFFCLGVFLGWFWPKKVDWVRAGFGRKKEKDY